MDEKTDEQQAITEMVRQFADEQILPNAEYFDHEDEFPAEIVEQMKELGLFGVTIPEQYGGIGLDLTTYVMIVEELSRGWISIGKEVVVAVGPWIAGMWEMLDLPDRLDVRQPDGSLKEDLPMWTYWYLQEGELGLPPETLDTAARKPSPVLHIDSDAPLHDDDGTLITDEPWGVYFKPDRKSVQGGAAPIKLGNEFKVDPYPTGTVDDDFGQMWSSSLSHCMERFEGMSSKFINTRSGGVGAFTVDNFPVFDRMAPNVFVAADSNHGYKMLAVGREIASVLVGEHSTLLAPFSYERFEAGNLHPVSNSPYPWS